MAEGIKIIMRLKKMKKFNTALATLHIKSKHDDKNLYLICHKRPVVNMVQEDLKIFPG